MVQIEELILRIPGYSEEDARELGNEAAQLVADGLPNQQRDRHMGALDIRVDIPIGASRNLITTLISQAILKGLV